MLETIVTAVITGFITLIGVMISNNRSQAVTETKLEELTREVREHNNFARRVPVLESRMDSLDKKVDTLSGYHMQPKE